jgi:hypothetical protein
MSGYSLLGLHDPTQWGIGGKDNFLTRFGVAMNRGLAQGDATYNLLNKQRSTMARTPYNDMASIAADRGKAAYWQNSTRGQLAQEQGSICLTAPNSYLCAQSRASSAKDPHVMVEIPPGSGRWTIAPQSAAYQDANGQWRTIDNGTPPAGLAETPDINQQFQDAYARDMSNEDQQWSIGNPNQGEP